MNQQFKYAQYHKRLSELERKTRQLIESTGNMALSEQLANNLNENADRSQLKIAFVGQYSSGKSTIISALTGRDDIKIDSDVATDVVTEYEWNNIILMDTPGILAGKVEEHDQRTKEALHQCDLIVYVLTSKLFDDVVFNNFIDLAYNQHLADKILLVVNKMNMENGDFDQLADNYMQSILKIFAERGYKDIPFGIAFIDASDYIEGQSEQDYEFIQLSNFERFIGMLNDFVAKKGIIKKQFDTPVRILQSAVKDIAVAQVDSTLAEFYTQFEKRMRASLRSLQGQIRDRILNLDSTAMTEVINLANEIGSTDSTDWENQQGKLNDQIEKAIKDACNSIQDDIDKAYEELISEMEKFGNKDAIQRYEQQVDLKLQKTDISIEEKKSLEKQKKIMSWLKRGGEYVGSMTPGIDSVFKGISGASGSQLHKIVYNVGKFFGKNFRPWEAVSWASKIGKVAKFGIPVISCIFDIVSTEIEDHNAEKRRKQIVEERNRFITGYQSTINQIKKKIEESLASVTANYNNKIKEANDSKQEIIDLSKQSAQLSDSIKELEGEYVDFIEIIDEEA